MGLPYEARGRAREGIDCWGLTRLVLLELFGVDVPGFDTYAGDHGDPADRAARARLIEQEAALRADPVELGAERFGDIVILRAAGDPIHVGLVAQRGWMLHIHADSEIGSCMERYDGWRWQQKLVAIYRLRALQ